MALYAKISGAWSYLKSFVKVSGAWRDVLNIYVKVAGAWRPLWSYWWEAGGFGSCSASCGGGWQYRSVLCRKSDGQVMADAFCYAAGAGAKPDTSIYCNSQPCIECYYNIASYDYSNWTYWIFIADYWGYEYPTPATYIEWRGSGDISNFSDEPDPPMFYYGGYRYDRGAYQSADYWRGRPAAHYALCRTPA